jgi:hypothetical protein
MKNLSNLSNLAPAETLLLTEGKRVPLKDLLKVTMMDLLLKQILKTVEVPNGSNETTSFSNTYVLAGNNYSYTKALGHERVYLSPFHKDGKAEILFNNLVKIGYEKAGSEKAYNKVVRDSAGLAGCFTSGISRLFNPFSLTDRGRSIGHELKRQLDQLSNSLPQLMESSPDKALEVLKHIKGNIFLVKGIDFKRMAEIENAVLAEVYSLQSSSNSTFAHPMTWMVLDLSSTKFDSSYSGCSTSDYSTDDGDSGCSGDSGCGGD